METITAPIKSYINTRLIPTFDKTKLFDYLIKTDDITLRDLFYWYINGETFELCHIHNHLPFPFKESGFNISLACHNS